MIIGAIREGLCLGKEDALLDIGCGIGALSHYFFQDCGQLLGIDFSKYHISVAKTKFEKPPFYIFKEIDAFDVKFFIFSF